MNEAVRYKNSSFKFKLNATNVKTVGYDSFFFDFQTKIPVSNIFYACLSSNYMIFVGRPKESLNT